MTNEKLEEWLNKEIEACNKLLERQEKQRSDSTKIAEYWFMKMAYENVLKVLCDE